MSIEESKDVEAMNVEELHCSLIVHEQKFKKPKKEDEHVFKIEIIKDPTVGDVEEEVDSDIEEEVVDVEGPLSIRRPSSVTNVTSWDIFHMNVQAKRKQITLVLMK